MDEQQLQQLISQIPPDVLLVLIQAVIEARPVVEAMLQASPEELQQAAQAIMQQMQGGGGQGVPPEEMQSAGQQALYGV